MATNQSLIMFLYFALSCAEALLNIILIPKYSSTDNNPISAIILSAVYHVAILDCNSYAIDDFETVSPLIADKSYEYNVPFAHCMTSCLSKNPSALNPPWSVILPLNLSISLLKSFTLL